MNMRFLTFFMVLGLLAAFPAFALDLHEARDSGLIGEKMNGYVAAVQEKPEIQALVAEINAKRRQEYARISGENRQPVDVVAKLAAEQIINNLKKGNLYQAADGSWKRR